MVENLVINLIDNLQEMEDKESQREAIIMEEGRTGDLRLEGSEEQPDVACDHGRTLCCHQEAYMGPWSMSLYQQVCYHQRPCSGPQSGLPPKAILMSTRCVVFHLSIMGHMDLGGMKVGELTPP